ncbi:putative protein [Aquifex aeolicus VF5]|uniref:Uncharacterized protein aq_1078 n=2 Tax=Aquifex aeolicus TaxID=63363 RepID=Y1078_AQUAE|nr:RecName: Full=Uncharacterized protein aq_1078 [Aquifex aeolicus VF5]AAC07136.1 putative protein [Aquifex aeolicus VF5]
MYLENCIVILTSTTPPWWAIPPAWSLGAEIQAYFLLPILLTYKMLGLSVFWISYIIYSLANLNIIHSDYFGYRLIPGVIFMFLSGAYLQKIVSGKASRLEMLSLIIIYIISLFWLVFFIIIKGKYGAYTRETLLGLLVGIPLVYTLLKIRRKFYFNDLFGKLSYGIFLSHFLSFWILEFVNLTQNIISMIFLSLIISASVSYLIITLIENKVEKIRYNLTR